MSGKKIKVVYWNNIPAPYMVDRFNALAQRDRIDFEAWFNDKREPDRSWRVCEGDWKFAYRYIPTCSIRSHTLHVPLPLFGAAMPDLLVSLYAEPAFIIGWLLAKLRRRRIAFWAQVTSDNWVARRAWKERVKRFMFTRVDAALGSGEESRHFAMRYGTTADRALTLQHSIDVDYFVQGVNAARPWRCVSRRKLGLRGTTFVYVGRLWRGKGVHYLIDAFRQVQMASVSPVSLLIVGDGVAAGDLSRMCRRYDVRNVVFAGFRQKEELPDLYAASDVFVFPTLGDPYGLVVDEAMASGLPVISSDAAGEIRQRVVDGHAGFIVPARDAGAMAKRMLELAENPKMCCEMGRRGQNVVSGNTPEKWAADFEKIVFRIMDKQLEGG